MSNILVSVWVNGIIEHSENEGMIFRMEGSPTIIRVRDNISYDDLRGLISRNLNLQRNQVISEIVYRLPVQIFPMKFSTLNITNDNDVQAMIQNHLGCTENRLLNLLELCVRTSNVEIDETWYTSVAGPSHEQPVLNDSFEQEANEDYAYESFEEEEEEEDDDDDDDDVDGDTNEDEQHVNSGGGPTPIDSMHPFQHLANFSPSASFLHETYPEQVEDLQIPNSLNEEIEIKKGTTFESKESLKDALRMWSIKRHYTFKVTKSASKFLEVKCSKSDESGCPWRVRACYKELYGVWMITVYDGDHTCLNRRFRQNSEMINSDLIANIIEGAVTEDPDLPIKQIIEQVRSTLGGFVVSYKKAWTAKQKAVAKAYGDFETSYDMLRRWLTAVQFYMPGSVVEWDVRQNPQDGRTVIFNRVFWAFKPCIDAFAQMKPMIQVDGTHLYGKYKGKLLLAMAQDGNRNITPIACAIVDEESEEAWGWFLILLRLRVVKDRQGLCLISDRGSGLMEAIKNPQVGWTPPFAHHVYCLRHLASNFNKKYKNKVLKKMFTNAGYMFQRCDAERELSRIRRIDRLAAQWIDDIPREKWSRAYDDGRRFGHMTTNLAECMNGVLKGVRSLPVLSIAQATLHKPLKYFCDRATKAHAQMQAGQTYCEELRKRIHENYNRAHTCTVRHFDMERLEAEVEEKESSGNRRSCRMFKVMLNLRRCDCGLFQALKYPCVHAIAACDENRSYFEYVDPIYRLDTILQTYAQEFHPVGGDQWWPEAQGPTVVPNYAMLRKKGRPKSTRFHNEMDDAREFTRELRCGLCREVGHNRNTCPNINR